MTEPASAPPPWATACLLLADGTTFWGGGIGARGRAIGEICFNTAITGYQEILTDPSYAGQIVTFTFPHIGNVGTNDFDVEGERDAARGVVLRAEVTEPSNFRATRHLDAWLQRRDLVGITGVDTRRLTRLIRDRGFQTAGIDHGAVDLDATGAEIRAWPGLEGMDLARRVTCRDIYDWTGTSWRPHDGYGRLEHPRHRVVAIDYGVKRNILRCLAERGCRVTVMPADSTAEAVLGQRPDGIFLSNGPGDPAATARYAGPVIRALVESGKPVFGVCLGHQMLALALGARTLKMKNGHHGANHPIKNLETGAVEITSQNHGFVVDADSLPEGVQATHVSLFDGTLAGLKMTDRPVFSVQYHPEASPGPRDSRYLFDRFVAAIEARS